MAHPNANGFLGARFPAGGIPAAYTLIANKFFDLVYNNNVSYSGDLKSGLSNYETI